MKRIENTYKAILNKVITCLKKEAKENQNGFVLGDIKTALAVSGLAEEDLESVMPMFSAKGIHYRRY